MLSTSLQVLTGTAEATASRSCFLMRACKLINNSSLLQLVLSSAVGMSRASHELFEASAANNGHLFLKCPKALHSKHCISVLAFFAGPGAADSLPATSTTQTYTNDKILQCATCPSCHPFLWVS